MNAFPGIALSVVFAFALGASATSKMYQVRPPTNKIPVGNEVKIVGGSDAPPHVYPHQVSLQFMHPKTKNWYHFCGGSILDAKTVVTAAHCVKGFESLQCRVDAGDHDLGKVEGSEQVFNYWPHEQFYHPLYDDSKIDFDYAIIKLPEALKFNDKVQPIELAEEDNEPMMDCWSSGWGNVRGDGPYQPTSVLQHVQTPIADRTMCTENYGSVDFAITDRMVCAGGPNPNNKNNGTYEGICQGDSGGPLICKDDKGEQKLVGISSFSTYPCGQDFPAGYARVSKVLLWITTFMDKMM